MPFVEVFEPGVDRVRPLVPPAVKRCLPRAAQAQCAVDDTDETVSLRKVAPQLTGDRAVSSDSNPTPFRYRSRRVKCSRTSSTNPAAASALTYRTHRSRRGLRRSEIVRVSIAEQEVTVAQLPADHVQRRDESRIGTGSRPRSGSRTRTHRDRRRRRRQRTRHVAHSMRVAGSVRACRSQLRASAVPGPARPAGARCATGDRDPPRTSSPRTCYPLAPAKPEWTGVRTVIDEAARSPSRSSCSNSTRSPPRARRSSKNSCAVARMTEP